MPTNEELDAMAVKVTGHLYMEQHGPLERARIMELAIAAKAADELHDISCDLRDLNDALSPWFSKSKLWEGEAYVRS